MVRAASVVVKPDKAKMLLGSSQVFCFSKPVDPVGGLDQKVIYVRTYLR